MQSCTRACNHAPPWIFRQYKNPPINKTLKPKLKTPKPYLGNTITTPINKIERSVACRGTGCAWSPPVLSMQSQTEVPGCRGAVGTHPRHGHTCCHVCSSAPTHHMVTHGHTWSHMVTHGYTWSHVVSRKWKSHSPRPACPAPPFPFP